MRSLPVGKQEISFWELYEQYGAISPSVEMTNHCYLVLKFNSISKKKRIEVVDWIILSGWSVYLLKTNNVVFFIDILWIVISIIALSIFFKLKYKKTS